MDIETLKLFVEACEVGNLSQVARRANLSPPTVTRRIQQLEKELGVSLIQRVHKGIAATAEGKLLVEKSATLLNYLQNITDWKHNPQSRSGLVTILGSYSMNAGFLLDDLNSFMALDENKLISIQLKDGDKQTITDDLRNGVAELGVLWNATDTSGLQLFPYRSDHAAAVVHRDHPLAKKKSVSYVEAVQFDTVRTKTTRNVELMLKRTGSIDQIAQNNKMEVPTFEAVLRLVRTGRYVGLCPAEVTAPYAEFFHLKVIPLSDQWAQRSHVIACRNSLSLSKAAQALLEHLQGQAIRPINRTDADLGARTLSPFCAVASPYVA